MQRKANRRLGLGLGLVALLIGLAYVLKVVVFGS